MQILLTFDSTPFLKHLTTSDDRRMIDFVIREYGAALEATISVFSNNDYRYHMQAYYQHAYFKSVLTTGNSFDYDPDTPPTFRTRVVDDDGNVHTTKGRYDELVEICIDTFGQQCAAVLRGIQYQARRIYTVDVLGYENRTLKILLKTDGAFQP